MPTTSQIEVKDLSLDLKNFRTVPQKKESDAIKAMISIKPDRFFAVMDSIIEDGYLPTENIIVLKDGLKYIVKEGNRRIASLKLIHGYLKVNDFAVPSSLIDKIKQLNANWKGENLKIPCTIFNLSEADKVDKVVTLAHGKGEKASRDPWNSVARARHNRDVKGASEPALDLLEKYLKNGSNLNNQQKERWGGEYSITILDEAMRKIHARLGFTNSTELAKKYPKVQNLSGLEEIIRDIGLELIKFETIRNTNVDFAQAYGINPLGGSSTAQTNQTQTASNSSSTTTTNAQTSSTTSSSAPKAYAVNDPKYVASLLKKFSPRGNNRQKVVTLRDEIKNLKIKDNPIAFCFLLRSMFEISAKAYCNDNSISLTKAGGKEKTLVELLRDITNHLTSNNSNTAMVKVLHGAMTEMGQPDRILSVTSMNHLVHNPSFSVLPSDVCTLFSKIYPLLETMN
ncbi:MAG: hypothetical protein Q7U54_21795 [Bacteroidales bacterium]|nr:hypothetical protein [Bacteroidales bacterium]